MATCREALGLDTDMPLVQAALQRAGIDHLVVAWDDDQDWSQFSLVVIRSTWDYHRRYDEFINWVRRVSQVTELANSAEIVTWNTDKRYLADLTAAGMPIVPTTYVAPGESFDSAAIDRLLTAGDVVVKPTVSAGSNDTERHADGASLRAHIAALHASGRTVMVQPYVREVDTGSETGLVYIDGTFSHAFAKGPMLRDPKTMAQGLYAEERIDARQPSSAERDLGDRVVGWVRARFGTPLYTRVDLLPSSAGPLVIEVEMTEPSLYVHLGEDAADRLARAIARRVA
ncbi:MAG: RimK family alpha-L-glutamate ligase [Ilumatobacteraceae bacterium]